VANTSNSAQLKRVTIYLPPEVEQQLRLHAAVEQKSRSDIVVQCLRALEPMKVERTADDESGTHTTTIRVGK